MKIARIAGARGPYFAIQGGDGSWVDIASVGIMAGTTPELASAGAALTDVDPAELGGGASDPTFLAPIVAPGKVMAIGLNYLDHIRETNQQPPANPILFAKFATSINDPYGDVVVDERLTEEADYEAELAVVIGEKTFHVPEEEALGTVFGYTVANDVSARDCQRADGQLARSKSFDTYCPIGPWITTADEVSDPQALGLRSRVNGETRQDSSTSEMLFPISYLIHYLARGMTLEPGDVILTGTPHGVGFVMDPPRFLKPGDVVEAEVDGLGSLRNHIVAPAD